MIYWRRRHRQALIFVKKQQGGIIERNNSERRPVMWALSCQAVRKAKCQKMHQ